ncbi:MAG: sigma-70 family RNA polymerase sigma factor [Phycisphaerae bacterium]|nr:sigma-70 family RNA polymerase sigma factor [Phycisphaerae bacterium]
MRSGRTLHPAEFGARLQEHARTLWCIAYGVTGDRTAAEDLVQEAAVVALGKLHEFDAETSLTAWMGQIVRFLALNERRRKGRERTVLADSSFAAAVEPMPLKPATRPGGVSSKGELRADQTVFDDELAEAVRSLDDMPRSCLLLRIVMDLSYKDISHVLAIPEGTAMSHVHRARKALRERLESAGVVERSSP